MSHPLPCALFEDDHLLVVNKPPGWNTHAPSPFAGEGIYDWLRHREPRWAKLAIIHRLDKETSGVLLFALNRAAQQHVSQQFQNNTVAKEYLALVRGRPGEREGEVDAPLAVHPTNPKRMAVAKHGGRPARTGWRVEETFRGFALIRCFPKTGKTHQIRVHLAHIGLPLAIDPLYGGSADGRGGASAGGGGGRGGRAAARDGIFLSQFKRDYRPTRGEKERPLISRLTLHAEKLTFTDVAGERVEIVCPAPKDLRATLNQMRRHAGR